MNKVFTNLFSTFPTELFVIKIINPIFAEDLNKEGAIRPLLRYHKYSKMKSKEDIEFIINTLIKDRNLFLVDLIISPDNKIEVYIDSMTGVNIATCREISCLLEEQLDRENEDFDLMVSSAGIGYPFKVPQQYQKNIGNEVEIKLVQGEKIKGILKSHTPDSISIQYEEKKEIEGKKKKETITIDRIIDFTEIKEVKDIVKF